MDTTSKLIDTNNIVSSSVREIKLDPKFTEQYSLSDFDQHIIRNAVIADSGMTQYQCKHFVANSQITPYKQVRQSLMELEVRYHAYQEIKASLRRAEIMRLKWIQQMDHTTDPLDKELIQIDIDKNDYDITIWKRKIRQSEYEMAAFLDVIKEYVKTDEDLNYYLQNNEEEERQYWIARMGKQAALDIISYGRVGSGNMDSIAMMAKEDQLEALTVAVEYSGLIQAGLHKISLNTQDQVTAYIDAKNMSIPELLDANAQKTENIQHTAESKVKPESI
jgi:hypothetical protein